ncbi:MAG: hypothetical protein RI897_4173 [Verrucomicrobiota bacterium]
MGDGISEMGDGRWVGLLLGLRGDAFFEEDIAVFGGFTGHDDGEGLGRTLVEGVSFDSFGGGSGGSVVLDDFKVGCFD